MATKGTYSAYQQLRPYGDGLTQDAQYRNEDGYRKRAEDRVIEGIEQRRIERAEAKKEKLRTQVAKNLQNYDTGSRSLNELQGRLLMKAMDEYIPIIETLENPNASNEDKLRASLKMQNLHNLPENLKTVTDFYTKQDALYKKGITDGKIWRDPDYEKKFQSGFENFILDLDEDGNPVVAFKDTNEDGSIDVSDVLPYEQIKTGLPPFQFQKKHNIEGLSSQIAKDLGTEDITTEEGAFRSRQVKRAKINDLDKISSRLFINEDGSPTDVALSALRERELKPTPENLQKVKDDFFNNTLSKTDYLEKEVMDYSSQTSRWNYARQASKDNKKVKIGNKNTPSSSTWGSLHDNINTNTTYSIPVLGNVNFNALTDANSGDTVSNANVENYTYDTQGNLLLDVSYIETKGGKTESFENLESTNSNLPEQKRKKQMRVSPEDEAMFASDLGLSVDQLRQSVQKPVDETKKEQDPLGLF